MHYKVHLPGNRVLVLPSARDLFEAGQGLPAAWPGPNDPPPPIAEAIAAAEAQTAAHAVRPESKAQAEAHQVERSDPSSSENATGEQVSARHSSPSKGANGRISHNSTKSNEHGPRQTESPLSVDDSSASFLFRHHPKRERKKTVNIDAQLALSSVRCLGCSASVVLAGESFVPILCM